MEVNAGSNAGGEVAAAVKSYWLGALLHGLEGEEFSAFGTAKEDGGVHLVEVPAGSAALAGTTYPLDRERVA
ncbi:MAG TPA: hypothetical protein PKV23_10800, partial [Aestuariivirga sp.]|nr:hypothetical protein [Aestuariivirga sp.]